MFSHIPKALIYFRLMIAAAVWFFHVDLGTLFILSLLYLGIISDVFDGMIARKLQIQDSKIRVLDTLADLIFYLSFFYYAFRTNEKIFIANYLLILIILGLEAVMYVLSIIRFKRLPSPHAILSKFWAIYLVVELSLILLDISGSHFRIALIIGVFVHMDRLLIYILIRKWEHDIPSAFHAWKLRKGEAIKRNSLFN